MTKSCHDIRHGRGFSVGFLLQEMRAYFIAGSEGGYFWAGRVDDSRAVGGGNYRLGECQGVKALYIRLEY